MYLDFSGNCTRKPIIADSPTRCFRNNRTAMLQYKKDHLLLYFSPSRPLAAPAMRPDSLPRLWRYINLLLTYLRTCPTRWNMRPSQRLMRSSRKEHTTIRIVVAHRWKSNAAQMTSRSAIIRYNRIANWKQKEVFATCTSLKLSVCHVRALCLNDKDVDTISFVYDSLMSLPDVLEYGLDRFTLPHKIVSRVEFWFERRS